MADNGKISIRKARVNNLKDVSLDIPRGHFIVITGISGSGKSSLAFNTLFAEGQRRFAESLSSYARQFLGRISKPDVDAIEGIPPAIAIEQKVNTRNPRSTVATSTEIYDYLRMIFARIGRTYSPVSGMEVKCHNANDVMRAIFGSAGMCDNGLGKTDGAGGKTDGLTNNAIYILADLGWKDRDDKVELMLSLKEEGFTRFYLTEEPDTICEVSNRAGKIVRIEEVMQLAEAHRYPTNLYLLIDRLKISPGKSQDDVDEDLLTRIHSSIETAFDKGDGKMLIEKSGILINFSNRFESDGITFQHPDEYLFSFNSPLGACPVCGGLGQIVGISEDLVVPDKSKTIYDGAIACWRGEKMGWFKNNLIMNSAKNDIPIFIPYCNLTLEQKDKIWRGVEGPSEDESVIGLNNFFKWVEANRYKIQYKYLLSRYSGKTTCNECRGSRLRKEALYVKVGGKTIDDLLRMTVDELISFLENISLDGTQKQIAEKSIEEVLSRLRYISDVGLGYLTLNRSSNSLSGGESQRINLVKALGNSLVGSLYILDEPSIGLHPRDTERLISVLKRLRDLGNTVVVVEHDEEIIKAADMLIDIGPKAGCDGGEVVFQGSPLSLDNYGDAAEATVVDRSLTLQFLNGIRKRHVRQRKSWERFITVEGAMEHNLKDITVKFPLNALTVVTGVSGSGKSSLVGDILYPALYRHLNHTGSAPGTFRGLSGNLDKITQVEYVDQNPIGKSSRSNAVTYLKIYDDIRKLLSDQQAAKINGFTPSHFSFNMDGGRCPECQGEGVVKIGMQFMADVTMVCESCGGRRFKPEILEVRYKEKNVDDILNMSVAEAIGFFGSQDDSTAQRIAERLQPLVDVGLSYIKLGQSSSTLSGGESQRIKLAYFLSMTEHSTKASKSGKNRILFIFDEPTTGLHFYDVEKLLKSFDALISQGHTIVVVEHNMDVIRCADWVIDLGPEAGDGGGKIVFTGTPEQLAACKESHTATFLNQ